MNWLSKKLCEHKTDNKYLEVRIYLVGKREESIICGNCGRMITDKKTYRKIIRMVEKAMGDENERK
jgi:hypothetical protein